MTQFPQTVMSDLLRTGRTAHLLIRLGRFAGILGIISSLVFVLWPGIPSPAVKWWTLGVTVIAMVVTFTAVHMSRTLLKRGFAVMEATDPTIQS